MYIVHTQESRGTYSTPVTSDLVSFAFPIDLIMYTNLIDRFRRKSQNDNTKMREEQILMSEDEPSDITE